MDQRGIFFQRRLHIEDAGQRLMIEGYKVHGQFHGRSVLGDHEGDGITGITQLIVGRHRLVSPVHPGPFPVCDILCGQYGNDPQESFRIFRMDLDQPSVRYPGPLHACPEKMVAVVVHGIFLLPRHLCIGV